MVGFGLQIAVLAALTWAGWSWLPATIVAVESAIVHNYLWHRAFTWADRRGSFFRFNLTTALTSITGNVVLMAFFVRILQVPVVPANVLAVGAMSVANFLVSDRWVFAALALLVAAPAHAAPSGPSLAAWDRYVAAVEARIAAAPPAPATPVPDGIANDVESATISDWRGSVFIPRVTLDAVLQRLQYPGTPPPQEDVAYSRVLARGPDRLRVYIRLVRRAIVTVTYDTEHEMTFRRISATSAAARSVATRIEEAGGGDHGFLWRLNSYWRYQQTDNGVAVSLQSLTLSRDVPMLLKPLAGGIIPRIARESMSRTLEALRAYFA